MKKQSIPLYLLMITCERENSAISIINNFIESTKPISETKFIVLENSANQLLNKVFDFDKYSDVLYFYFKNKNKSKSINYAISNLIKEDESLIILIDDDIKFDKDFLLKYYLTSKVKGNQFYFGAGFTVSTPKNIKKSLMPFMSSSALGKGDKEFNKMTSPMFLGFNYAVFKSQWLKVNGLDERFAPGSKFKLGADESVFQKKLMFAGYSPFYITDNLVEHKPEPRLFLEKNIARRQRNNGYTHGFQILITSKYFLKADYFSRLIYLIKRCFIILFRFDFFNLKFRFNYTYGFFLGLLLYIVIDDKKSYLDFK